MTKITILNWNLKLYEGRLGWNTFSNPRLQSNWSNYSPDQRLFILKFEKMIVDVQETIYSYSLNEISFKHSKDVKIDLEVIKSKRLNGFGV